MTGVAGEQRRCVNLRVKSLRASQAFALSEPSFKLLLGASIWALDSGLSYDPHWGKAFDLRTLAGG